MKYHHSVLLAVLISIAGCSSHPLQLTQIEEGSLDDYERLPRGKMSATSFALFGVIPINFNNREVRARNALLSRSGGTDIIDSKVSSKYFWTPIGPFVTFRLEATPIKRKNIYNSKNNELSTQIKMLHELKKSGVITETEYDKKMEDLLGKHL